MASTRSWGRLLVLTWLGGTALASSPMADAQEAGGTTKAAARQSSEDIGDIIVTARKREEKVLNVPQSITALTGAEIANSGDTNLSQLQQEVPGLRIVQLSIGTQRVEIRGISQYQGLDTVGSYLDEVSVAGSQGADPDIRLIDLQNVEVLRGPQPTLYGNFSVGGTIRYVTKSPDLSQFSAHAEIEGGLVQDGGDHDRLDAVLNIPIIEDKLGLRLVADHDDSGGWVDVPAIGVKDGNGVSATTLRGKLLFKPIDDLNISLTYQYQKESQDNQNFSNSARETGAAVATPVKDEFHFGNLVISYDLGPVTLLSTSGLIYRDSSNTYDVTPFYAPYLAPGGIAPEGVSGPSHSATQEFRLTSNDPGPLKYLIGGEYTDDYGAGLVTINTAPKTFFSPYLDYDETSFVRSKSWAIFGSVSYDFLDDFTVEFGARYFHDDRIQHTDTVSFLGFPDAITDQEATFNSFNPRVDLSYRTGESGIVYFNWAKGFRSGGFNAVPGPEVPLAYGPEKLYSYEIGAKQQFFDKRVTIEPAVYFNDYQSIQEQLPIVGNVQGNSFTINAGKARGPGFDFTTRVKATEDLSLSGTVGYTHVRLRSVSLSNLPGDPLNLVPNWSWSVAADYHHELGDTMTFTAHADYGHTGAAEIILRNFQPTTRSDNYNLANARLGLDFSNYELYFYVNNLFDENRRVQPAFGGYAEPLWTRPRTIGIGAKADF